MKKMLSVKELATLLSVSAKTIYGMCDKNAIPYLRIGSGRGTLRFDLEEVKKALTPKEAVTLPPRANGKKHLR